MSKQTILHIAGHGKKRNGDLDPGASGLVKQGEWRYFAESFFDHLKKYEQKDKYDVVYHIAYNVYDYGNLVNLARQYGNDTIVIEWHFDAGVSAASGGHVIVYSGFAPDALDLRLRDAIDKMVGVRYSHRGQKGISGRSNLANVNRAANGGVDYRLIETGFGTSPVDSKVMLEQMDAYAKAASEAIYNTSIQEVVKTQQQSSIAGYHVVKSGDTLWAIANEYGTTVAKLKEWNKLSGDTIFPGQSLEVQGADLPLPKPAPKPASTPVAKTTSTVTKGAWVRVPANKLYSTGNSASPVGSVELSAQVDTVNNNWKNQIRLIKNGAYQGFARISDITGGTQTVVQKQSAEQVAQDIAAGKGGWGNDPQRSTKLKNAGYDPKWVQDRVNQILAGKTQASKPAPKKAMNVGTKVKIKSSAKRYATGELIPGSRKNQTYTIMQKGTRSGKSQVLLKEIMSWVWESDVQ